MTIFELRAHPEYQRCMEKIKAYRPSFQFRMQYDEMPEATANAIKIVLRDAVKAGYLILEASDWNLRGELTGELFTRTKKRGENE